MVEHQPSKLDTWVRFPSPAPKSFALWSTLRKNHFFRFLNGSQTKWVSFGEERLPTMLRSLACKGSCKGRQ